MKTLLINAARCSSAVLLSAAVLLGTVSCGPKSTTHRNPEGLVSVNYADLKQGEDILISEWVGEPEFIAMESRSEALVTGGQFTISDHYIGVYRKNSETPFKLFDREENICGTSAASDAVRESTTASPRHNWTKPAERSGSAL